MIKLQSKMGLMLESDAYDYKLNFLCKECQKKNKSDWPSTSSLRACLNEDV